MINLECSKYPFGRLFKPQVVVVETPRQLVKAVKSRLNQTVHPTQEEVDWCKKKNWPLIKQYATDDFDTKDVSSWKQEGIYWIRTIQGPNAHCWTNSRIGATARWRNSPGSYCTLGRPYYDSNALEKFSHTMELIKPLVRATIGGKTITISLERTLNPPIGNCWGIKTGALYFRVAEDFGKGNYGTRITRSWVALTNYLETLLDANYVPNPPRERNEFQNKDTQTVWENLHKQTGSFEHVGSQIAIAKDLNLPDKDYRGRIWGYKMHRDELPPAQQMVLEGIRSIKSYIMEGVDDTKVKWRFLANKFWKKYRYHFSM